MSSAFRPGPWSATEILATLSWVDTAISIGVFAGVCTRALRTRLPSTCRRRVEVDLALRCHSARVRSRVARDGLEIDRLGLKRTSLVESSDEQHVVDQRRHPDRFLLDAPACERRVLR